tara:strand:- start:1024 stop:3450 length:2427 start_codon:yes stop_codon:yes gene_type:complete
LEIDQLVAITGGKLLSKTTTPTFETICFDSRQATFRETELFAALRGQHTNGHQFISSLAAQGTRHFLVDEEVELPDHANVVRVESCLRALQQLAIYQRSAFKQTVIGITGSNGKTIVKEWLTAILAPTQYTLSNPKSYNSQLGVALSVWPLSNRFDLGIFEAGISKPGEMDSLELMIAPTLGIFTNIGPAHEENFNSLEEKIREKLKLFKRSNVLIYEADQQELAAVIDKVFAGHKLAWSRKGRAEIEVSHSPGQLSVQWNGQRLTFSTSITDEASMQNLTHCIIAALYCQTPLRKIQEGLDKIKPVKMRLELKRGVRGNQIIDDTYNNDLAGLGKALSFMEQQHMFHKKALILSDFIQSNIGKADLESLNELLMAKGIEKLFAVGPQLKEAHRAFHMEARFYNNTEALLESDDLEDLKDHLILIKGARQFALERVSRVLTEKVHHTVLEINLDAIRHNLNFYRSLLKPRTKIMAVIKAFAYGSGSSEVARLLEYNKVDYLAVAYADEGIALRKDGIKSPIMVMNPNVDDAFNMIRYRLEPEIYSLSLLREFHEAYNAFQKELEVHLILNTGMNRLGFNQTDLESLKEYLRYNPGIRVNSIFSHLAASDEDEHNHFTLTQIESFKQMASELSALLNYKPLWHILNSGGITRFPEHQLDMVRLGIGLHGVEVNHKYQNHLQRPAVLKTIISQIRKVKAGETIGYSRQGKAEKDMVVAVIAIGYADGYLRAFSQGKAFVCIKGQPAPTIGNVCMDMTMIDVTAIEAKEGDEVIVFGNEPTVSQLAEWAHTIPYEILTNVSSRVKRVFYSE